MNKIIAKGKLIKIEMEVVCFESEEGLSFEFNGNEDSFLERIFRNELEKRKPIGGTFYPKTNSLLNAYNVLNSGRFFDELISIKVEGEIEEIPFEKGKIY